MTPLLLALIALNAHAVPGWTEGQVAVNAVNVLVPPPNTPEVQLPDFLVKAARGDALLVYFSPRCPHCWAVTPELNALAKRLKGRATVIGVATSSSTKEQIEAYRERFDVRFEIITDQESAFAQAIGARSTPTAVLLRTTKKGQTTVLDGYSPYKPGYDTLVEMRLYDNPWDAFRPDEYQGNAVCGACHDQEMGSWYLSYHSLAWPTLVRAESSDDPSCTGCHVTGAKQPTGWSGEPHSPLVNVGCEACHSAGGPHDGKRVEAKSTCEGCHDADHAIHFSYEKGLPLLDHFKINGVKEADFRATREQMFNGELPKALLAFPTGSNKGSESCQPCHTAIYNTWKSSPHASAMSTLGSELAQSSASIARHGEVSGSPQADARCVRCHTLSQASGPVGQTLADFKLNEGVGCEACHGPGEAHINAKGDPEAILGLGDSCPVCVIESVCTSCHTPQHDPDWDLDRALPLVGHGSRAH